LKEIQPLLHRFVNVNSCSLPGYSASHQSDSLSVTVAKPGGKSG